MAELVDALVSGTSVRKDVQVRVLFRVQKKPQNQKIKRLFSFTDRLLKKTPCNRQAGNYYRNHTH